MEQRRAVRRARRGERRGAGRDEVDASRIRGDAVLGEEATPPVHLVLVGAPARRVRRLRELGMVERDEPRRPRAQDQAVTFGPTAVQVDRDVRAARLRRQRRERRRVENLVDQPR